MVSKILLGFIVKLVTGFDDLMVHIPIVTNITKTRKGRIAFSLGILGAITLAIIIATLFSSLLRFIPNHQYTAGILMLILAFSIQFELFSKKPKEKTEEKLKTKEVQQKIKVKRISTKRFFQLLLMGFVIAFVTVIDDVLAYSSILITSTGVLSYAILGIYLAAILEIFAIIYFSRKIRKFPYKKQVTVAGLMVLAALFFLGIL
jgi:predicted tellurium resistance membrane protein TerC